MNYKQLTKDTIQIGLDAGFNTDTWNILDANCLLEVREAYSIHTYESLSTGWVAAYKKIRGHGKSIMLAELDCIGKIINN